MPHRPSWDRAARALISQATGAFLVAGSDTVDLPKVSKALLLSADDTVRVTLLDMDDGTYIDLPLVRGYNPLLVKRVWASGTGGTASIFGLT